MILALLPMGAEAGAGINLKIFEQGEKIDWERFLRDWPSGCDDPISAFPEELLAAFPSAKFILTRRPAERWHHSINSTFCQMHDSWFMGIVNKLPFFPFTRFNVQVPALNAIIRTKFAPNMAGVESWKDLCESKELGTIKPPLNIC